jgi:predicted metal-binding protein
MKTYQNHLFVCTNKPDQPGKCGNKGAEGLRLNIKKLCQNQPWAKDLRVNSSGCLGNCESGIAAVLYPQAQWISELRDSDSDKLMNFLQAHLEKRK